MSFRSVSYLCLIATLLLAPAALADPASKNLSTRPSISAATGFDAKTVPATVVLSPDDENALQRIARALEAPTAKPAPASAPAGRETAPLEQRIVAWLGTIAVIGGLQAFLLIAAVAVFWRARTASEVAGADAKRAAEATERSTVEMRAVAEAQARAYVGVTLAKVAFDWPDEVTASPVVEIVAINHGQSPAREFVWNATVQYIRDGQRREQSAADGWPGDTGVTIGAGANIRDTATVDASVAEFALSFDPPATDIVTRLRLAFRYRDVFGHLHEDSAYVVGVVEYAPRRPGSAQFAWRGEFYPAPAPSDWDASSVEAPVAVPADEPELPLEAASADSVEIAMEDIASAVQQAADEASPRDEGERAAEDASPIEPANESPRAAE